VNPRRPPDDPVARIRSGDIGTYETLFRMTHAPLVAFVTRIVGTHAAAEDVVQELFADLWIDRARLDVRTTVRAYLFAAARNRALNVVRRQAVELAFERPERQEDVRTLHPSPPQPDALLDDKELQQRVSAAIASLPERARLVMELRWRAGLTYAEVADAMGISIKGVENQLARALKRLREQFG
jgi:RNA polymerase sigma-70 factor (ECF subfamily)